MSIFILEKLQYSDPDFHLQISFISNDSQALQNPNSHARFQSERPIPGFVCMA